MEKDKKKILKERITWLSMQLQHWGHFDNNRVENVRVEIDKLIQELKELESNDTNK